MQSSSQKVGFVSLGCPKALVDSERIITQLRSDGYELVGTHQEADVVIINTCGFVDAAVEESLDSIKQAMDENGKVIVTGCLGAKADFIRQRFPNLLHISGPQAYEAVVSAIHEALPPDRNPFTSLVPPQGIKLTPRHYAYLKISEGCNHKCTFCIIPSMRGKLASRTFDSILAEAKRLQNAGVRELLIISQDTSAYGIDLKEQPQGFQELVEALGELGIWVRLHYVYPYPHVDDVIPLMAQGKILPYLDIPFQHASRDVLKAMKRPASSENNLERIRAWRKICPDITIRSTFIVGFPGETEQDFEELLAFLEEAQLDRVGCFTYSPVEGARANELADQIPEDVKQARYERFMSLQATISTNKLRQKVGKTMRVLIDSVDEDGAIARSAADAPEIDGLVYVSEHPSLKAGEFVDVIIDDSDEYDLYGSITQA